ncbi:hypothetical protein BDR04DRAFT_1143806 [Suillus decipiens]|nr:hypothetical protein BDR04DRAFT_1143806 [Suillus decipiens]
MITLSGYINIALDTPSGSLMDVGRRTKHDGIVSNRSGQSQVSTPLLMISPLRCVLPTWKRRRCILIYDHISTLPEEIAFIWCRPKALSAMLFFVNRYVALLVNIFYLFSDLLPISNKSSLSLRVYALYGCSRRLLRWMVIISLPLAAGALIYPLAHSKSPSGCHGIAWLAMFIYELLIFVLTVFKTCRTRGLPRFFQISRRDILGVMFHDGICSSRRGMTLVNLPNILTYFCGSDITRGSLSTMTSCMSVTLISRLMLNLRESVDTGIFSTPATTGVDILTTRISILQSEVSSEHW